MVSTSSEKKKTGSKCDMLFRDTPLSTAYVKEYGASVRDVDTAITDDDSSDDDVFYDTSLNLEQQAQA